MRPLAGVTVHGARPFDTWNRRRLGWRLSIAGLAERPSPAWPLLRARLLVFAILWAVVVGFGGLYFLCAAFDGGVTGVTVDLADAEGKARHLQTPGPWNGNQAWTAEEVDRSLDPEAHLFWAQVQDAAAPFVQIGAATLVVGSLGLGAITCFQSMDPRRSRRSGG